MDTMLAGVPRSREEHAQTWERFRVQVMDLVLDPVTIGKFHPDDLDEVYRVYALTLDQARAWGDSVAICDSQVLADPSHPRERVWLVATYHA